MSSRSSLLSSFPSVGGSTSPDGDTPQTQPMRRGTRPVEGRTPLRQGGGYVILVHLAAPDLDEDGHDPSYHPPQEGIGPDVDDDRPTGPPHPDRLNGPDRVPIGRPKPP